MFKGHSHLTGKAKLLSKQNVSSSVFKFGASKHTNSNEALLKTIDQSPTLKTRINSLLTLGNALTTCLKCNTCILVDCNKATENNLVLIRCPKCKNLTNLSSKLICDSKKSCNLLLSDGLQNQFKVGNQKVYGMKKKSNYMVAPKGSSKRSILQTNASCKNPIFNPDMVRIFCQKCNELINCNDFHDHEISCSTLSFNIKCDQLDIT